MFRILLALVVLAPLPFGAVLPWTWGLMGCVVGLLLIGWCAERIILRQPPAVRAVQVWPVLTFFFVSVVWALLQMAPFMPESWEHPIWKEASVALGSDVAGYISLDPFETGSALVRLLTLGGIFWLALQYGRDRRNASIALYVFLIASLAYAAYGLAVHFSGTRTILWFPKTSYIYSLTSTFVNRNSYATYAGLGLVAATAMLVRLVNATYSTADFRMEQILRLLSGLTKEGWLLLIAWVALATALLLSQSRGGLLATCAGMIALFATIAASRRVSRRNAITLVFFTAIVGFGFLMYSGGGVAQRLADTSIESEERARAYELTYEAVTDSPWLGTGYGSFASVFRMYRDETIEGLYDKAHNTFLENALELGMPAALALLLSTLSAVLYCAIGVRRRRRDVTYPTIALAASVLVGTHSLVDFSLQIPAIGATFALILGIGCAQSWSSRPKSE